MLSDIMQAQEDTYRMVHLYVEFEKAKSETGWRLPRVGGWGGRRDVGQRAQTHFCGTKSSGDLAYSTVTIINAALRAAVLNLGSVTLCGFRYSESTRVQKY